MLLEEDSLLETMSALSYLAAAIIAFVIARRNHPARRALWFVGTVALVGFLDELSFGERLFDLQVPVIRGKKIDAVHDVVSLGFRLTREFIQHSPAAALPLLASTGIAFLASRGPCKIAFSASCARTKPIPHCIFSQCSPL